MMHDPLSGALFLFCNRHRRIMKALVWDRNGFWLLQKRLEGRDQFLWPDGDQQARQISSEQLHLLLDGMGSTSGARIRWCAIVLYRNTLHSNFPHSSGQRNTGGILEWRKKAEALSRPCVQPVFNRSDFLVWDQCVVGLFGPLIGIQLRYLGWVSSCDGWWVSSFDGSGSVEVTDYNRYRICGGRIADGHGSNP